MRCANNVFHIGTAHTLAGSLQTHRSAVTWPLSRVFFSAFHHQLPRAIDDARFCIIVPGIDVYCAFSVSGGAVCDEIGAHQNIISSAFSTPISHRVLRSETALSVQCGWYGSLILPQPTTPSVCRSVPRDFPICRGHKWRHWLRDLPCQRKYGNGALAGIVGGVFIIIKCLFAWRKSAGRYYRRQYRKVTDDFIFSPLPNRGIAFGGRAHGHAVILRQILISSSLSRYIRSTPRSENSRAHFSQSII